MNVIHLPKSQTSSFFDGTTFLLRPTLRWPVHCPMITPKRWGAYNSREVTSEPICEIRFGDILWIFCGLHLSGKISCFFLFYYYYFFIRLFYPLDMGLMLLHVVLYEWLTLVLPSLFFVTCLTKRGLVTTTL